MSGATISACGKYRYSLERDIRSVGIPMHVTMVNPSYADAERNDQTVYSLIRKAEHLGCSFIEIGNLYAYITSDPKELLTVDDPVGPENDWHLASAFSRHHKSIRVVAWGRWNKHPTMRDRAQWIRSVSPSVQCFGMNKDGSPKHPLFLPTKQPLELWPWSNIAKSGTDVTKSQGDGAG